jgi:YHS domain-containing protein
MNLVRKSACLVVLLGAVAGCTDENQTTTPSNSPASPPPAPGKPIIPPATKSETPKDGASKEMPPSAKPEVGKRTEDPPKVEGPKSETKTGAAAVKLTADEIASIKELPAAEQEQALKQAVCPVSGHHLGSMEKPYKTTAEGRTFFLCCEDCQKDVKADAKSVLAKLDARSGQK